MELLHARCCGLDIHKQTVVACVRVADGQAVVEEIRSFTTMTHDLLKLGDWLREHEVRHVAMEATGVYWKPIWNLLEDQFELMLVNAQHLRAVPGRKTDVKDSQWIAQLLAHGLLRPSFVPDRAMRQLRELVRWRVSLVQERNRVANRIQKLLEDANIKLSSVASDVLGKSGRAMLGAMADGQNDPAALAELALRQLRGKIPKLREALRGAMNEHHRFMLREMLDQVDEVDARIARAEARIEEQSRDFCEAVTRLETVPGVGRVTAQSLVAEIGVEMSRFPTAGHLASWAGMCPGNHESAGKRLSGKTRPGNKWLRRLLIQAAWAASRAKGTYLREQYHRIAARRGRKRAIVAVGHTLLVIYWHMMSRGMDYVELGEDYLTKLDADRKTQRLVRQLQSLGHKVLLDAA
jgi:transposase